MYEELIMCVRALGQLTFEGNADIVKFFKVAQEHGLWVCLRVGPYIAAEWNQGYDSTYTQHATTFSVLFVFIV